MDISVFDHFALVDGPFNWSIFFCGEEVHAFERHFLVVLAFGTMVEHFWMVER